VHSTTLYYPLVATPMIAPTKEYQGLPALTPREAAGWMVTAAPPGRFESRRGCRWSHVRWTPSARAWRLR
jgi:hypothetical protein